MIEEFFGIGETRRPAEGYLSWQHLVFVSALMVIMIAAAVALGVRNRHKDERTKNRVLIVTAVLADVIELCYIVFLCFREQNPMKWTQCLPLFLCTIQLITMPVAAFSKGRLREASLDFIVIFGIMGAVFGTYFAGNNYSSYPVLGVENVESGIIHAMAGFAALYILIAGMASMKKKNMFISYAIMTVICAVAYVADVLIPYNYMFLMRGDGTPYDIFYNLVNGNRVLYPLIVLGMFYAYIFVFYLVFRLVKKGRKKEE